MIRSEIDSLLSEAHTWLDSGAQKVLEKTDLKSLPTNLKPSNGMKYDKDIFINSLSKQLVSKVHNKLQTIRREKADYDQSLVETANSHYIDQEIEQCLDEMSKAKGSSSMAEKLGEVPPNLLSYCKDLKNQADMIYNEISEHCNNGKKFDKASNNNSEKLEVEQGWQSMVDLKEALDNEFAKLKMEIRWRL